MASLRTHIVLPQALAEEIDQIAGPRGRSAFLVETAAKEIKRRKLLAFLDRKEPVRREVDHAETAKSGAAAWVHNLRRDRSRRQRHLDELARKTGE